MKHRNPILRATLFIFYLFGSVASAQTALQLSSAEQSSTSYGGAAARAIDGNTDGTYRNKSVTHTRHEQHPWWQASLGSSKYISEITIHNRTDSCCTFRLGKLSVYTSDQPFSADADRTYKLDNDPNVQRVGYVYSLSGSSVTLPINRSAKYIRFQIGTLGTLSLAEVEVTGIDSSPTVELSLSDARQSTTGYSAPAARAIDGNTSGVWRERSVTHTLRQREPWWQAKLPSNANASDVQLWNRTDCCSARLSDFYVFVSNSPFNDNDSVNDLVNDTDVDWYFHSGTLADDNVTIPITNSGEYIRVQLSGVNPLSLAEVKVFGSSTDGMQTYSKTAIINTFGGYGGYSENSYPEPGFDFNGRTARQNYPNHPQNYYNGGSFLIDGTEQFISSPLINDAFWRSWKIAAGIANGYLHFVVTIRKSNQDLNEISVENLPPLPLDSPNEIWQDDSFEIYFNVGNESTQGYDENDFVRIYRFPNGHEGSEPVLTTTGINSQLDLTNEIVCSLEENNARSCEVRFSLEELGIAGQDEVEIGFDMHMNFDDDGGDREAKYSWCSADTVSAWRDMSAVNCSLKIVNDCENSCGAF